MKKKNLLWISVFLLMLSGCSRDDEVMETESYDPTFQVKYYNQDPNLNKRQGYWYQDSFIEMIPQKKPPYLLMVKWDSDEGEKALDYIVGKDDGVVLNRFDNGEKNTAFIVCQKYFTCPYLFVSSSYKTVENSHEEDYIRVSCRIVLMMESGKSHEAIERDYADVLKLDREEYNEYSSWLVFDCNLKTSYEVLQLAEEIHLRDDVQWAEPDMYMPFHVYCRM
jgi:hypothetical protein